MSSEAKFSPPELTESERLARVTKLTPREQERQKERKIKRESEMADRQMKVQERKKEREEKAAQVRSDNERLAIVRRLTPQQKKNQEERKIKRESEMADRQMKVQERKKEREEKAAQVRAERRAYAEARAEERARTLKEEKAGNYESFELSEGKDEPEKINTKPSGRVVNKNVIKRNPSKESQEDWVAEPKLDRILEAYEEAETVGKFMEYMLETSDFKLSKEQAENNPGIEKYLRSKFKKQEQEFGFKYEDFVHALPTDQEYEEKKHGMKVEEAEPQRKTRIVPEKSQVDWEEQFKDEEAVEEIKPEDIIEVKDEEPPKPKAKPRAKPPRVKPPKETVGEKEFTLPPEARAALVRDAAKKEPELPPEARAAAVRAAQEEEEEFNRANQKFAPKKEESKYPTLEEARSRVAAMPEANRRKAEAGPLVKKLSVMPTKEGVKQVSREVKQELLDEIMERYVKKLGSKENAHNFLMGPEVKGWFKGGQRRDQEKYKNIYKELHG